MKALSTEQRKTLLSEIKDVLTAHGLNSETMILVTTYTENPRMVEYVSQSDGTNPLMPHIHGVITEVFKDLQSAAPYPPLCSN